MPSQDKKSFSNALNPALRFISTTEAVTSDNQTRYIFNSPDRESKSKRLQLLIRPSTHAKLKEIADAEGGSVNDLINIILEEYLNK